MSSNAQSADLIPTLRESLRRCRLLLLDPTPQNIDICRTILGDCAHHIRDFLSSNSLETTTREFAAGIEQVRNDLKWIAGLLDAAASFRREMLGAISPRESTAQVEEHVVKAQHVHVLG